MWVCPKKGKKGDCGLMQVAAGRQALTSSREPDHWDARPFRKGLVVIFPGTLPRWTGPAWSMEGRTRATFWSSRSALQNWMDQSMYLAVTSRQGKKKKNEKMKTHQKKSEDFALFCIPNS